MIKYVNKISHNKSEESSQMELKESGQPKTIKCKAKKRLARARDLVKHGYSVIPAKGKIPAIPWNELRTRLPTDEELVTWFGDGTQYNIAIVTGKLSGVIVIDCDTPEAVAMVKASGLNTAMVQTGKGVHFYCRYKEGITGFQQKEGLPGIDLRSEGQLAVAPDSIHENGKEYVWIVPLGKKEDLADVPEWIVAKYPCEKIPITLLLQGVVEGMRNIALTRVAGHALHNDSDITLEQLKAKLHACNDSYKPPLPKNEVDTIACSIFKLHSKNKVAEPNQFDTHVADHEIFPVVRFPLKSFQKRFQKFITLMAPALQIDPHVLACIALTILSASIGNTLRVSPKDDWEVPPFLWLVVIAESGYGKSHAQRVLMKPINKIQSIEARRYAKEMAQYQKELDEYKKAKPKPEAPVKPEPMKHIFSNDFTFETLVDIFEVVPRGILIHSDEVGGFILSLNQYKGGAGNDRQRLLQLSDAMPIKVDRKGKSKFVSHTGAAILGGIQPAIMPLILKSEGHQDGLTSRFIFVRATPRVQKYTKEGVPKEELVYWEELVNFCFSVELIQLPDGDLMSRTLSLSEAALEVWIPFYERYHNLMQFLSPRAKAFVPKLIGYSLRLAGVLNMIGEKEDGPTIAGIRPETIEAAIALTEYFAGQAVAMQKLYDKPEQAIDERLVRIVSILHKLSTEVKHGKLPVARIREEYNLVVPEIMLIPSSGQTLSRLLGKLGLSTETSTGNNSFLIWDEAKMQQIFAEKAHYAHLGDQDAVDTDFDVITESPYADML